MRRFLTRSPWILAWSVGVTLAISGYYVWQNTAAEMTTVLLWLLALAVPISIAIAAVEHVSEWLFGPRKNSN
jgi:hypothetical protein